MIFEGRNVVYRWILDLDIYIHVDFISFYCRKLCVKFSVFTQNNSPLWPKIVTVYRPVLLPTRQILQLVVDQCGENAGEIYFLDPFTRQAK